MLDVTERLVHNRFPIDKHFGVNVQILRVSNSLVVVGRLGTIQESRAKLGIVQFLTPLISLRPLMEIPDQKPIHNTSGNIFPLVKYMRNSIKP